MELTLPSCPGAESLIAVDACDVADELLPPSDFVGLEAAALWLIVGSTLVGIAITAFGWQRTLAIWSASAVALPLVFAAERLWYKYVVKSE
jgi:hypothetical protein